MSKKKKIQKTISPASAGLAAEVTEVKSISSKPSPITGDNSALAFGRSNYLFMLIGLACIAVGFLIMTMDKEPFGFGFLGITLGPIVVFAGFMVELYAILKKKS